jgi:hypothetical protein
VPTHRSGDGAPIVEFDVRVEVSPFVLFRRLADGRDVPLLLDVRGAASSRTLAGAQPLPPAPWTPPADRDTVLFDDDGSLAVEIARRLQAEGHTRVRALFGGLELYQFALDSEIVGTTTFLVEST